MGEEVQSKPLMRACGTMTVHRRLLDRDPHYRARRERLENSTLAAQACA